MRIAFVAPWAESTLRRRAVTGRRLAEGLADRGHRVWYLSADGGGWDDFAGGPYPSVEDINDRVPVESLSVARGGRVLGHRHWRRSIDGVIDNLALSHGLDVVHHIGPVSITGAVAVADSAVPTVIGPIVGAEVIPAGFGHYLDDDRREQWRRRLVRSGLLGRTPARRTLRRANALLAATPESARLCEGFGADTVRLFPDVALPDDLVPDRAPERAPADHLRVLWGGSTSPERGLALAMQIVAEVHPSVPIHLRVLGTIPDHPRFNSLFGRPGMYERVEALGPTSATDRRKLMADADVLLHTPLRETSALVMGDAMATGLPTVALEHHAGRALFGDQGGILLPVTNPADVIRTGARVLARLHREPDLRSRLGIEAWAAAHSLVTSRRVIELEALYERVAGGS